MYNKIIIVFIVIGILSHNIAHAQETCTKTSCRYGECEVYKDNYVCHCVDRVKGKNCNYLLERGESLCLSNPCWNGGTCKMLSKTEWECACRPNFIGKYCRTEVVSVPVIDNKV